jgi:3-hydroxyisobutyrate dehydrogenase
MEQRQPDRRSATVALLGTGRMGRPVARRLLAAGFNVRVWNRTVARAAPLVLDGAYVAPFPARAAEGADVLLTLLPEAALHAATTGGQGALATLPFGAVWLQMGDIGIDQSARLRQRALGHRVRFVDAPFTGSEVAAGDGDLLVMASGSQSARIAAEPVLAALARQTLWVDHAGGGPRLKHALGAWVASLEEGSVERVALSAALGSRGSFPGAAAPRQEAAIDGK